MILVWVARAGPTEKNTLTKNQKEVRGLTMQPSGDRALQREDRVSATVLRQELG